MNNFFKTFWAALLAFVVGSIVVTLFMFLVFAGMVASLGSDKAVAVKTNSVLTIDMANSVVDAPANRIGKIDLSAMTISMSNTMLEVLRAIEMAESDKNIKGIYLNFTGSGSMGISQTEELRAALVRFKENSGKFVVAYNENYSQMGYYLASVADVVAMNPEGMFDWRGVAANVMFYKGLLDKLEIDVEILRHGTFKSAVEPYMTDKMSPANRLQTETYVKSLWGVLLDDIASSRNVTAAQLQDYAARLAVKSPEEAVRLGLVDVLLYEDEVANLLAAMVAGEEVEDYAALEKKSSPNKIALSDYITATATASKKVSKNKIAIVYAEGEIRDGESSNGVIGGASVASQIRKARKDNGVKAVVIRVNSPGGSALASEVMWRELELLRQEKPVIVSMGNYAASGGYYISCGADAIIADRTTLTGSIGVFGMMMNLENTLKNKLGITVDVAKSAPYADMGMPFRAMQKTERDLLMGYIEDVYETFVGHVADGRNMTPDAVDAIGQGRVWLGVDAKEIGLIDGYGGLTEAISLAANRAGVADDFRIYEVVDDSKGIMSAIMQMGVKAKENHLRTEMGDAFVQYNYLMNTLQESGVQARLPYTVEFY